MYKNQESNKEHIFIEHIRKHLWEMDLDDKRVYCKICNKPIDEIVFDETKDKIWIAEGVYELGQSYIDRNGRNFKMVLTKRDKMTYKRTVKCYQCEYEKTRKCESCDDNYSNLKLKDKFKYTLVKKG